MPNFSKKQPKIKELRRRKVNLCLNIFSWKFHHLYLEVWKHVVINYTNNQREKQKWVTLGQQKACYRPNFKTSKDPSNGTKIQEMWHTHPENLEL